MAGLAVKLIPGLLSIRWIMSFSPCASPDRARKLPCLFPEGRPMMTEPCGNTILHADAGAWTNADNRDWEEGRTQLGAIRRGVSRLAPGARADPGRAPSYRLLVPRSFTRAALIGFLWAAIGAQIVAWVLVPAGIAVLATVTVRGRRRGIQTSWAARRLLLLLSVGSGLIGAEVVGAVWLASVHRFPVLPTRFDREEGVADQNRSLLIAVIGESSARGNPYEGWLSVPAIVAWQLERVLPDRKVEVQILAKNGATLEQTHLRLAELRRRPDAIFVYAGNNEFHGRFSWGRNVPHYVDDYPPRIWDRLEEMGRRTSFGRIMVESIERQRLDRPPLPGITRELVDVPAFTCARVARCLPTTAPGWTRLGPIAAGSAPCRSWSSQPATTGISSPTARSFLPGRGGRSERRSAVDSRRSRDAEAAEPALSIRLYRTLAEQQPGFAETHFRLAPAPARGDAAGARRHLTLARDLDGMPHALSDAVGRGLPGRRQAERYRAGGRAGPPQSHGARCDPRRPALP